MRTFTTDIQYIGDAGNAVEALTNKALTMRMIQRSRLETSNYKVVEIANRFDKRTPSPVKVKITLLPATKPVLYGTFLKIDTPALKEAHDRGILTTANYNKIKVGGLQALEQISTPSDALQSCYDTIKEEAKDCTIIINREAYDKKWKANIYAYKNRAEHSEDRKKTVKSILNKENNELAKNLNIDLNKLFNA